MEWIIVAFKILVSLIIGYLLSRADTARRKQEWNEAFFYLGLTAVAAIIIH